MEEKDWTITSMEERVRESVDGLFFMFKDEDMSDKFQEWASDVLNNYGSETLAAHLADSIENYLINKDILEEEIQEHKAMILDYQIEIEELNNINKELADAREELTLQLRQQEAINEVYSTKTLTGDSKLIEKQLDTITTLTSHILEMSSNQTETIKDMNTTAMDKLVEISNKEFKYPEMPQAQVHIVQQPVQQTVQPYENKPELRKEDVWEERKVPEPVLPVEEVQTLQPIEVEPEEESTVGQTDETAMPSLADIMNKNKKLGGG